jgi:uncharacterized protein
MRVVLDTNVVVSALLWGGTPFKLLQAASDGDITLYTSPALLAELRGVLAREHLIRRLVKQHASIEEAIHLYGDLSMPVTPLTTPRAVPTDAADDHVIAAALAAGAALIVTGDRDLLILHPWRGIQILNATEALQFVFGTRT